jgi:hypothetical protein
VHYISFLITIYTVKYIVHCTAHTLYTVSIVLSIVSLYGTLYTVYSAPFTPLFCRAQLLAARSRPQPTPVHTLKDKINMELKRFLKGSGCLATKENPMDWWRENHADFPLLAKFWRAHSSYPATSASAERAFNLDGLILTPRR